MWHLPALEKRDILKGFQTEGTKQTKSLIITEPLIPSSTWRFRLHWKHFLSLGLSRPEKNAKLLQDRLQNNMCAFQHICVEPWGDLEVFFDLGITVWCNPAIFEASLSPNDDRLILAMTSRSSLDRLKVYTEKTERLSNIVQWPPGHLKVIAWLRYVHQGWLYGDRL